MPSKGNKKTIAILQSCYIPWKGYFDLINSVDEFILYDEVQYTRRDWRNRNLIKTSSGKHWITIPVEVKGKYHQRIDEVVIFDSSWANKHWKAISLNYLKAPFFRRYQNFFEKLYLQAQQERFLSKINYIFIKAINEILGISTKLTWSTDYQLQSVGKTEKLIELCQKAGAGCYLSGPSAQDYVDQDLFCGAGVELCYMDYSAYPGYQQLFGVFEHHVTILDLIFNVGDRAREYMQVF